MRLSIQIKNVQHLQNLYLEFDLSKNSLMCLVGRNGTGKTTLVKCLRNLRSSDTFSKTTQPGIFRPGSSVTYNYDESEICFAYDHKINDLNSRTPVPSDLRNSVITELPMPYGQRFSGFQKISSDDNDIRTAVMLREYSIPHELISFLNDIYSSDKFSTLQEIAVGRNSYYVLPLLDDRYIREDHFSSGEYFLISLYRKIKSAAKLIVIDEIDISLDAAAQVHLIKWLRRFCEAEKVNLVFTTHSLALMKTLKADELYYIEETQEGTAIQAVSYNYIKSVLFGFSGCDKYILTEDVMLKEFLEHIIKRYCSDTFFSYQVIPVAGAEQVVQLMQANERRQFLSSPDNVISILDGDQRDRRHARKPNVFCTPFANIEQQLWEDFNSGYWVPPIEVAEPSADAKQFYKNLIREKIVTNERVFMHLCLQYEAAVADFAQVLVDFLVPRGAAT